MKQFGRKKQLETISNICKHNAGSLLQALTFCHQHDIKDFRVNSQIWPLKTHPDVGYDLAELPNYGSITDAYLECGEFKR